MHRTRRATICEVGRSIGRKCKECSRHQALRNQSGWQPASRGITKGKLVGSTRFPRVIRANMRCNSLSRCDSKFRIISSKELPVGEPEALNTQAHSEQPKPRKRFPSIHTSLRSIRILGSVCDTSHSSRENFLGEETRRGRNELDIDSAVMLPTDRVRESAA